VLQQIVDWGLYNGIGLNPSLKYSESINYFVYDSIKIVFLLFLMIFIMGVLRTYISEDKIKKWLSGRKAGAGNLLASVFGAVTPFCSCSSVPIFLSFLEAQIPLGVSFSFLITSPLINEYLVVLMLGFFGWEITLAYVISGILIGTISGMMLGKMNLSKYLVKDLISKKPKIKSEDLNRNIKSRFLFGINEAFSIVKKLWIWILVGVAAGAVIHNYVPEELIHRLIGQGGIFTVPVATLIGVPMYGSCAAIVPIALALFQKGIPIGTALAFMMAISALSFPEAIILRRAMKLKLIAIFFGIVTFGIIFTGYLFNALQSMLV